MSEHPRVALAAYGSPNHQTVTYSLDEWLLVFRATPGIGVDAQIAWYYGGSGVTTDDVACQELNATSCAQHYRHPVVDSWAVLGVKQVKLVFYKGQMEKYTIFDGVNSNHSNWFHQSRVIDSSWPNLASDTYQFFSIDGDIKRNFFTAYPYNASGCYGDSFYTLVLNANSGADRCTYDSQPAYPRFFFATGLGPGHPQNMQGMDFADLFAIFIK